MTLVPNTTNSIYPQLVYYFFYRILFLRILLIFFIGTEEKWFQTVDSFKRLQHSRKKYMFFKLSSDYMNIYLYNQIASAFFC